MKRWRLFFATVVSAGLLCLQLNATADNLTADIIAVAKEHNIPAIAAARIRDGAYRELAVQGKRRIDRDVSVGIFDKFHIGSNTKAMTATLAAILIEDGRLSWNSTVREVFSGNSNVEQLPQSQGALTIHPITATITLEQLLAHKAGLARELPEDLWKKLWKNDLPLAEARRLILSTLLASPPAATPGARHLYSNAGYVLVGLMLEKVSGKQFEWLLTDKLFTPLNMSSCGFGAPGDAAKTDEPDQPWGHTISDSGQLVPVHIDNPAAIAPSGTVHCSTIDYLKFLQMHVLGYSGKGKADGNLLNTASFKKLHQSAKGTTYTFGGWDRISQPWAKGPVFTHAGSNTFFYANVWFAPEKKSIYFAATNSGMQRDKLAGYTVTNELIARMIRRDLKEIKEEAVLEKSRSQTKNK